MGNSQLYSLLPLVIVVGVVAWVVTLVRKGRGNAPATAVDAAGAPAAARPGGFGLMVERLCWVATLLFCVAGAVRLFDLALNQAASAPQYAAEAAGVCAAVLVPYVFSRAVQALRAG